MIELLHTKRNRHIEYLLTESSKYDINSLQSYFPSIFSKHRYSKWQTFQLQNEIIEIKNDTAVVKNNENGKTSKVPFFVKKIPIISLSENLCDHYPKTTQRINLFVPNSDSEEIKSLINKINKLTNTAYVESTVALLLDSISSPHFPKLYGIYNGISPEYEEIIRYSDYAELEDVEFLETLCNQGYKIEKIDSETDTEDSETYEDKTEVKTYEDKTDSETGKNPDDECKTEDSTDNETEEEDEDEEYKLTHPNIPVQILITDKFDLNFDEMYQRILIRYDLPTRFPIIRKIRKKICEDRITAWMFQILAGLSVANKNFNFVHNDLHVQNIMGKKTRQKYVRYVVGNQKFKVPTYGYILKIIDFGRSSFVHNNKVYLSDIFDEDDEAGGQYDDVEPSSAFDVSRFACSFVEDMIENRYSIMTTEIESPKASNPQNIFELLYNWTFSDCGETFLNEDGFDLYVKIANNFRTRTPISQIKTRVFSRFIDDNFKPTFYVL